MSWRADAPEGAEAAKVVWDVVQYLRGAVLDLGCGPRKVLPHVVGVDSCKDTGLFGIQIEPDLKVDDCSDLGDFNDACVDAVFSSHLIEHLDNPLQALKEWWRVIKSGGYLVLYWPDPKEYPRVGQPGANPDHKADYQPEDMIALMEQVGSWDLLMNERRNARDEYSVLQVYQKLPD